MFHGFILAMDTFALGLIKAAKLIEDGRVDEFVKEKYRSFESEIGQKILKGSTLEELAAYAEKLGSTSEPQSGGQEYLQSILNNVMFD